MPMMQCAAPNDLAVGLVDNQCVLGNQFDIFERIRDNFFGVKFEFVGNNRAKKVGFGICLHSSIIIVSMERGMRIVYDELSCGKNISSSGSFIPGDPACYSLPGYR